MVQKYEVEPDEIEPKHIKKENKIERTANDPALGDVFDVYGMVSKVHSITTNMTRDYVLAHYTSEIINAKFPRFVREQRKTVRVIKSYLLVSEIELRRKFQEGYAKTIHKSLSEIYQDIENLLLGEVDEMVIISRAGQGEVTKAMLEHGKKEDKPELLPPTNMREGLMEVRK